MMRPIALLLTVLTGFSGLVYEVAWQKYLATLLGSHSEADRRGAGDLPRRSRGRLRAVRPRHAALRRARAGAGRGAAAAAPLRRGRGGHRRLRAALPVLSAWRRRSRSGSRTSARARASPSTCCSTVAADRAADGADGRHDPGPHPGARRATSTKPPACTPGSTPSTPPAPSSARWRGAFLLIPRLGLDGVLRAMGLRQPRRRRAFLALERRAQPALADPPAAAAERAGALRRLRAGRAARRLRDDVLQTTLNRIGALSLGASHFTFAMVVAVFVLCIALGSFAVSALRSIPRGPDRRSQWLLVGLLALLYSRSSRTRPTTPTCCARSSRASPASFYPYHFLVFLAMLARARWCRSGSPARCCRCSSTTCARGRRPRRRRGPALRLEHGRLAARRAARRLRAVLLARPPPRLRDRPGARSRWAPRILTRARARGVPALAAAARLAPAALGAAWCCRPGSRARLTAGLFRERTPQPADLRGRRRLLREPARGGASSLFYDDDPTSTVAVDRPTRAGVVADHRQRQVGRHLLVRLPDHGARRARAGAAGRALERAFVIGWGTGVTAGELAALDDDDARSSWRRSRRRVLEAAPLFDDGQPGRVDEPEGRARAAATPTARCCAARAVRRDRLGAEQPLGHRASRCSSASEFLERRARRLAPGGVYAQWFHLYETTPRPSSSCCAPTRVFAHVAVWFTRGPDILLLGFKHPEPELDLAPLRRRSSARTIAPASRAAGSKLDRAARPRDPAARGGGRDGADRARSHAAPPDPEPQRGARLLPRRGGDAAAHAFGGSQPGGREALPARRELAEAGQRGSPGGASPATPVRWRGRPIARPAGALDGQPSGLAAASESRARAAIDQLHRLDANGLSD